MPSTERALSSAILRELLPKVMFGQASPQEQKRATDLLAALAGGDWALANAAVAHLLTSLENAKNEKEVAVAVALFEAFFNGKIDLIGVREENGRAEFVWAGSSSALNSFKEED